MNSGSDIFSSATGPDIAVSEALTERLYAFDGQVPLQTSSSDQSKALNELRKLAIAEPRHEHFTASMAREYDGSIALEERIQSFQVKHADQMRDYIERSKKRPNIPDDSLYVLNGWNFNSSESISPPFLTEESRKSQGGHYLRWAGKGIVINPGPGFIKNFHAHGLCIRDIDFVIVTRNCPEAYEDVKSISELNSQLNKSSSELQIIHYYLHHKARQELGIFLKPSFKQARNTIHNLEMFIDSPDVEKIDLDEGICLHYFLSANSESFNHSRSNDAFSRTSSALGIRLELSEGEKIVNLGYVSGMGWSPLIAHHLSYCSILLASFGHTNPRDYSKLGYNEDTLGYHGCYSLFEEVSPNLMLLTEFSGRDGDVRIEIIKKIRQDLLSSTGGRDPLKPTILPADIGLTINLHSLKIRCTMSQEDVPADELRVVASAADFGRLNYLSPCFCI